MLLFCAIGLSEGGIPSRRLAGMPGADLLVALTNTSAALSVATAMAEDVRAGWLLVPPAAILLLVYRAYVSERAKHRSLEFLYGVARSLSRGRDLEPELLDLLRRTLSRGRDLEPELLDLLRRTQASFRVRVAELVLLPGEPGVGALRTALGPDGREDSMVDIAHADAAARGRRWRTSTRCWWSAAAARRSWAATSPSAGSSRRWWRRCTGRRGSRA